ncbi:phosphotransferase KptA/Tpt1 [Armillaria novae-zelandiae]|uniref:2'-phosphotransferase n=1 Tax=Armillaria novae-zelandiae TaxID=153914 RepID=A0AA39PVM6_9AGAR|nr:phosphotransferase KptA/Tpt1 [Armillaria novae-zelandiae]
MSYLLRHGAVQEGIPMRSDGYVRVNDLLKHPMLRSVDFMTLEQVVKEDAKGRYHLMLDPTVDKVTPSAVSVEHWWICSTQGHSISVLQLDLEPILSATNIPMALHGTTEKAWKTIAVHGISRMTRTHIHLAQGFDTDGVVSGGDISEQETGKTHIIPGIRDSSRILIYINVAKALEAGIKFYLSKNGVVLTPGNESGYLEPQFFHKVERVGRKFVQLPLDSSGS